MIDGVAPPDGEAVPDAEVNGDALGEAVTESPTDAVAGPADHVAAPPGEGVMIEDAVPAEGEGGEEADGEKVPLEPVAAPLAVPLTEDDPEGAPALGLALAVAQKEGDTEAAADALADPVIEGVVEAPTLNDGEPLALKVPPALLLPWALPVTLAEPLAVEQDETEPKREAEAVVLTVAERLLAKVREARALRLCAALADCSGEAVDVMAPVAL